MKLPHVLVFGLLALQALHAWSASDERAGIESQYQQALQDCEQRFAVTDCRDEARARRQRALQPLLDAERQEAAQRRAEQAREQRELVQAKQQAAATDEARKRTESLLGAPAVPASSPPSSARPAKAKPEAHARELKLRDAQAEQTAQRQREQAMQRQQRLRDHQQLVQRRVAERAERKASAASLPVPAASAIAGLPAMTASTPSR